MAKKLKKPEICKPCWELKYCPYGVLVELMPFPDSKDMERRMAKSGFPGWTPEANFQRAKEHLTEAVKGGADDNELWNAMFGVIGNDPDRVHYLDQFSPQEIRCNFFGHVCPAFSYAYLNVTETRATRRAGRFIPRDVMLKVVRRDNYTCQECGKHVDDNEVEFDHIIPHSRGGPLSVENIRLLCRPCNRKKSDSLAELLDPVDRIEE